jgi:hypothetical protein
MVFSSSWVTYVVTLLRTVVPPRTIAANQIDGSVLVLFVGVQG